MAERVSFKTPRGADAGGVLALPRAERSLAVVVIHEWWGVNEQITRTAERLAEEGFVALVPDLYRGTTTTDAAEAQRLMNGLDWAQAIDDLAGAAAYLRGHARGNGRVAVTGFCMGGALTFAAAANIPGLSAAVPYYGVPGAQDWAKAKDVPIQAHFAIHDEWATVAKAEEIQRAVTAAGGRMELFTYDAQHAFCNDRRPEVYSPDSCANAWKRTVDFLRAYV